MDHRDIMSNVKKWYRYLNQDKMVAIVELSYYDEEDEFIEEEVEIPFIYEVCETCDGKGTHVNPSIDSHGITFDEWNDWDEDDREGYFSGRYDVTCYECNGLRVVPVPNEILLSKEMIERVNNHIDSQYDYAVERHREMEMGY